MYAPVQDEDVLRDSLVEAWDLFKADFVLYLVAGLLLILATIVSLGLLSGPLTVGFINLVEKRLRGEEAYATDIFDGLSQFGASLIATLLIAIGVFIGILLLVLPGLLFGLAMMFAFQAIAIENESATGSMERSYAIVKENFALCIVFFVILVVLSGLGGMVLFGNLLTVPFSLILMTVAYRRLRSSV